MNAPTKFKQVLAKHGALNANTGSLLVKGISGEDCLLNEWRSYATRFIHKGVRVTVGIEVERMYHNESRCYPVIAARI